MAYLMQENYAYNFINIWMVNAAEIFMYFNE